MDYLASKWNQIRASASKFELQTWNFKLSFEALNFWSPNVDDLATENRRECSSTAACWSELSGHLSLTNLRITIRLNQTIFGSIEPKCSNDYRLLNC